MPVLAPSAANTGWNDFELTTVGVLPGNSNVRALVTDLKVFDAVTGNPVNLRQNGVDVTTIRTDASGRATFQAENALVVRVEALGWSMLVESDQQKIAKGTFAGDLDTAVNGALDRAEADGRLLSPEAAAATYATQTTVAGKVGKGDLVVNVRDHGAKGDGTTDDTEAIRAATQAAGYGTVLFPTGTYRVTGSLPDFWKPERVGDGVLTDGTYTFRITPRHFGDTNILWVNGGTGVDGNDGLFPGTAVKSLSGLNGIFAQFRGEAERGTWKVRISGTIVGGFTFTALPQFRNFLFIEGDALVNGKPVTAITYDGGQGFGMRFEPSEYLKLDVRNIAFTGFSVGFNGYGLLFKGGGVVRVYDCVADGCDIGFAAINNVTYTFTRCEALNSTADGFRSQYSSSGGWSECYSHHNGGNGFFISRNSVGHLDDSTAEANTYYGLLADMNTRIATVGSMFKRNIYGVRLEGGAEWNRDDTRPNLFYVGTADANTVPFAFFGNSRMTTLHSIKATNEFRLYGVHYNASGSTWHTDTTSETLLLNLPSDRIIPAEMLLDADKKVRLRFWGRYQGTGGTKTVTVKVGTPDWTTSATAHSTVFSGTDGFKTFTGEVELAARPPLFITMDGLARVQKTGEAATISLLNFSFDPTQGLRPRLYGTLAAAADQMRIDGCELYVIG